MAKIKSPVVTPTGRITMLKEWAPGERWKMTSNAWRNTYFAFSKLIADAVSLEKATELAGKLWESIASYDQMAHVGEKIVGAPLKDMARISQTCQYEGMVEGYDFDIAEETEKRLVYRLLVCPWWEDFKRRWHDLGTEYFTKVLCWWGCDYLQGELCKIVNPRIKVSRASWIVKGDPSCDYVFEFKE